MSTVTETERKKLWAFGRNSFTEERYAKYVGMAAGLMRAEKVKIPKEIPNPAIFGDDFGFSWTVTTVATTTILNPSQGDLLCLHFSSVVLRPGMTDWQKESGYLPAECTECGWSGMTNLWGHGTHRIEGTRELCKICNKEGR